MCVALQTDTLTFVRSDNGDLTGPFNGVDVTPLRRVDPITSDDITARYLMLADLKKEIDFQLNGELMSATVGLISLLG